MIKSISFDEQEILRSILQLHCKTDIQLDATYSKGNFYKKGIPQPIYKYDINPIEGVEYGDCRNIPLPDDSIDTAIFDPPFLATTGKSLTEENNSNKINKRFGVYKSEPELYAMYYTAMREYYRVLKHGGTLIFKCQDKVSSGKQYFMHCDIMNEAKVIGYKPVDLFILLAKNRLVADWQVRNQKTARKFHCYYWVFRK